MIIYVEQKKFLERYVPYLEQLLLSDDINDLLLETDDAIIDTFDANGNQYEEGNY